MATKNPLVAPIVKWVGGKRQLLDSIIPLIPSHTVYYEPFVGGGAVLFKLQPKIAVVNDSNKELMNVYHVIQTAPEELIKILAIHKEKSTRDYFYEIRSLDRDKSRYATLSNVERAARIIYLNKTCYNGLFRVNSSGEFNTPWGRYKNPNIINEPTISAIHKYLTNSNIQIQCRDYRDVLTDAKRGSFIYLDPPYMPLSSSSSFTGYTATGFGEQEQVALKEQCDILSKKNIKFLLSNSCCDFIKELYKDYVVEEVSAKRTINSVADKRGAIEEVLIRNYECDK